MKFTGCITRRLKIELQQQISNTALIYPSMNSLSRVGRNISWLILCLAATASSATAAPVARIAVLDFGSESTATRVAAKLRAMFTNDEAKEFTLIDSDSARA